MTSEGAPDAAPEGLGEAFGAVARRLRWASMSSLAQWDVTPSQMRAVRVLAKHGGVRSSELARHLGIAPRSATEVVDALEERSLVARQPDPDDRRATSVVQTEAGARLREVLDEARRTATEQRLSVLSDADRAELDRILRLVVAQE